MASEASALWSHIRKGGRACSEAVESLNARRTSASPPLDQAAFFNINLAVDTLSRTAVVIDAAGVTAREASRDEAVTMNI